MATIIIYDPNDTTVANRITAYLPSANTPDFASHPNALVNPDLAGVAGVRTIYWKYDDPNIVEMSAAEKAEIDGVQPAVEPVLVRILEEDDDPDWRTDGNYGSKGLEIVVPATVGVYSQDFNFPYLIAILSLEYVPSADMDGDCFTATIGPETTLGAITSDVSISDTVINVPKAIINRRMLKTGRIIHLDDGVTKDAIGEIVSVDKKNGTITVDVGSSTAFSASTPTLIKSTIKMANSIPLRGTVKWDLGESKIGGSPLPPTTVIHFEYDNKSGTAKTFSAVLQYLY